MTTNTIIDLTPIQKVAPDMPYSRKEGVAKKVKWIQKQAK